MKIEMARQALVSALCGLVVGVMTYIVARLTDSPDVWPGVVLGTSLAALLVFRELALRGKK